MGGAGDGEEEGEAGDGGWPRDWTAVPVWDRRSVMSWELLVGLTAMGKKDRGYSVDLRELGDEFRFGEGGVDVHRGLGVLFHCGCDYLFSC